MPQHNFDIDLNHTEYDVLGVAETFASEDIDGLRRLLAKRFHPDNGREPHAARMAEVNDACDRLGDTAERKEYDEALRQKRSDAAAQDKQPKEAEEREASAARRRSQRAADDRKTAAFKEAVRNQEQTQSRSGSGATATSPPNPPKYTQPPTSPPPTAATQSSSGGYPSLSTSALKDDLLAVGRNAIRIGGSLIGALKGAAIGFGLALGAGFILELLMPMSHVMSSLAYSVIGILIMVGGAVAGFIAAYDET